MATAFQRRTSPAVLPHRPRMARAPAPAVLRCRKKFLRYFPGGFEDETYVDWEREYKWQAHLRWSRTLGRQEMARLLRGRRYREIAREAVAIEARTNLLFSFEKMAIRDALKHPRGSRDFSEGIYRFLHDGGDPEAAFEEWCSVVAALPRRQTRVLTWPIVTVFAFIAQPDRHVFLKPTVTKLAAKAYGYPFEYASHPNFQTYRSLLAFANQVGADQRDLRPRDMIDLQSFIWVQGSDEY